MSAVKLAELNNRWSTAKAAERANFQLYITELCDAIAVPKPQPAGSGYEFELPVRVVTADGTTTTKFIDLVKEGCFLLEAKDADAGKSNDLLLRRAFGQVTHYAAFVPGGHPPYLLVLDVGNVLLVWDRWSGTYGGFQAARRIHLPTLHERPKDIAFLRDVVTNPSARDPRGRAAAVTRDIAAKLARLAAGLEDQGHEPERVARFLMRCVFTMFAEDVGLLPDRPFEGATELGLSEPGEFASAVRELWAAMDEGRRFGLKKLLRFNGHFFIDQEVLPLTSADLVVLRDAARADWADVEPTIFGTLLVRALDPVERHKLGAEYTPREYVERVVRVTVEEPVREQWTLVQAEVLQLRERGRPIDMKRAVARLREFHTWLRGLKILDPACGSGNFLYVVLAVLKSVELEVLREIESITGIHELPVEEVNPGQFYGIEVKPWARELAELTLWIGYYQWWRRTHGHTMPPEPVLKDTGTLECRDAVLVWDEVAHRPERDRPDPTPRIKDPVTSRLVPDPEAKLAYHEYVGARPAEWPEVFAIVGNPPYIGQARMRDALGDGYTEALRDAYPDIPPSADLVMYWWHKAAEAVASGKAERAGLITSNSITQSQNRRVVERAVEKGVRVCWAVADHPWVDEADGAAVRVAMTVIAKEPTSATRVEVDQEANVVREVSVPRLNADLTAHADVASAASVSLLSNAGLASPGLKLHGSGFILPPEEATRLLGSEPSYADVIRPYRNGRDLTSRPRGVFVIDFGVRDEEAARKYAVPFDIVRSRVKPEREANNARLTRENWWRFGRNREELRDALSGLDRYIVTVETAKHRCFVFLDAAMAPDNTLICIASDDAYNLGVLSSFHHVTWALAAGGRLGVGNDPRYTKSKCFDPFPFPDTTPEQRAQIASVAERLDQHRKAALDRDRSITVTGMYNVLEKLRAGETLNESERQVHDTAACAVLRDLHDELDSLVAGAYGWIWPMQDEACLEHLVALQARRVQEEQDGLVRWLRPAFQAPRYAGDVEASDGSIALDLPGDDVAPGARIQPWPDNVISQLGALRDAVAGRPATPTELAKAFAGAKRAEIAAHMEALAVLGVVQPGHDGRFRLTQTPLASVAA
jgi:hypothetical protein